MFRLLAIMFLWAAVPAAAEVLVDVPNETSVASLCDGQWRASHLANTADVPIYVRQLTLHQRTSAPAYVAGFVFVSHPNYEAWPNLLMATSWAPGAELWQSRKTEQAWDDGVLLRPGEWLTLLTACYRPDWTTQSQQLAFEYSTSPTGELER